MPNLLFRTAMTLTLVATVLLCLSTTSVAGDQQNRESGTAESTPAAGAAATAEGDQGNTRSDTDTLGWIAVISIIVTGFTIAVGSIGPAMGEGRAVATALTSIAQQPDASNTITRTLFVGLAMIESTAIYCFVVSMILLFANPFWNYFAR